MESVRQSYVFLYVDQKLHGAKIFLLFYSCFSSKEAPFYLGAINKIFFLCVSVFCDEKGIREAFSLQFLTWVKK